MKKKLVISASLVALALSVCLFAFSVFAVGHNFAVNNTIKFVGADQYVAFDLNAEITGTTQDGDDALKKSWSYDYSKDNTNVFIWDDMPQLIFNTEGKTPQEAYILYTFVITNKSVGKAINIDVASPVVTNNNQADADALKWQIVGTDYSVAEGETRTVSIRIMPKNGAFEGERKIELNLSISSVD